MMPTLSEVVRIPQALPNGDSFLTNNTSIVEGVLTFFITVTITQTRKMERITPATARIAENIRNDRQLFIIRVRCRK